MYICFLGQLSDFHNIPLDINDRIIICSGISELLENLRSSVGSGPAAVICKQPIPDDVREAVGICFPEAAFVPFESAAEHIAEYRDQVLRLTPGFSMELNGLLYAECSRKMILFHRIGYVRTLRYCFGRLPFDTLERHGIIRCHDSFAVNLNHVRGLAPGAFILEDGTRIPIGRTYSKKITKYRKMFRGNTSRLND
ncbi:MAG: LytTR family transcriptional regulator [Lachnospiraceae bacterium]|nr:LytTR family transcriptional regulator [Lachnospiraceae bacterium]